MQIGEQFGIIQQKMFPNGDFMDNNFNDYSENSILDITESEVIKYLKNNWF